MSNKISKLCRPLRMSAPRKAVLMCLADFAHDDGKDWHSIAAVMEWTCLARRTIFEAMEWLEAEGLVVVQRRLGAKNTTFLQLDRIKALADQCARRTGLDDEPVRQAHGSEGETNAPGARVDSPEKVGDQCATRTDPCATRTPTSAPGAQTSAPGAPEALEASLKHQEASGVAATSNGSTQPDDLFQTSADAESAPAVSSAVSTSGRKPKAAAKTTPAFEAYAAAFTDVHHDEPIRNAKVNALLSKLVDYVGADEAPALAAFYVRSASRPIYASRRHPLELLLQDVQAIRTEMRTGVPAPDAGPMSYSERNEANAAAQVARWTGGILGKAPGQSRRRQTQSFEDVNYLEVPDA